MGGDHIGDDDWRTNPWLDGGSKNSDHESEPSGPVTILEIGPWKYPATRFHDQFPGAQRFFVEPRSEAESEILRQYPDATFLQGNIFDYLTDPPEEFPVDGFDYIVACNVVTSRGSYDEIMQRTYISTRVPELVKHLFDLVNPGGQVIFEETLEEYGRKGDEYFVHVFRDAGFEVEVTKDKDNFFSREGWHKNAFHIEATKPI